MTTPHPTADRTTRRATAAAKQVTALLTRHEPAEVAGFIALMAGTPTGPNPTTIDPDTDPPCEDTQ